MRLWLSGTLLNIAQLPRNWTGQVNEVVNIDQPGAAARCIPRQSSQMMRLLIRAELSFHF
jgi:hypothetical protein